MQLKILQVINNLVAGGAEKLLLDSVPLFQKRGLNVDVLLLNGSDTPLLNKLKKESSGKIYSLGENSVYNPLHIFKLIKYLKEYNVIHVHLFPALYWIATAKLISRSKTKIIFTEHSTNNRRRESILFSFIDTIIYQWYDSIITIASEVDKNLKGHINIDSDKVVLINNGIDTSQFQNAKPYPKSAFFSKRNKILIQVSGFRKPKDQATLIRSLTLLPDEVKLLLVGDGKLINECKKLVKELSLRNRVQFLGVRMDVPRLLKTADIVVLSSHYEGMSLSSIEGMSSGNPFVASNVPGLREIVERTGLLFKQGDEKELAMHIRHLLDEPDFYAEVANKCMQNAEKYDIHNMVNEYINVYKNVFA
jgi:glycosyltransferase involved in cell wall biosynthesis